MNGLQRQIKKKDPPQKRIHYGRFKFTAANTCLPGGQSAAQNCRFEASVGVHSQSLGHRHVGNPITASVAHTLVLI
jgi:hypothetical protein